MSNIRGFARVTKKAIWVLMLTIVPIVLINAVWDSIVEYIPLFFSVVFLVGAGLFMFFYIKFYNYHVLMFKMKRLFSAKESIDEYMYFRFKGEEKHRSKYFLIISMGLIIAGGYMIYLFFNPSPTEVEMIELL